MTCGITVGQIDHAPSDRYTMVRFLGEGSFGCTWEAKNSKGQSVAIKIYKKRRGALNELKKELAAVQQVSQRSEVCNKYAACYIEHYVVDGEPRLVMDFISGGENMYKYMKSIPLPTRQNTLQPIQDLVLGLAAIHSEGITHQDIKEENIMWDSNNKRFRYIDWGLACLRKYCGDGIREACKPPCGSSGTAYTAPPEMTYFGDNEKNYVMAVAHDIWSLGIVLLDWYTLYNNTSVGAWYYTGVKSKLLSEVLSSKSPYNVSQSGIRNKTRNAGNAIVVEVLDLMLTRDYEQRIENWQVVLDIVTGERDRKRAAEAKEKKQLLEKQQAAEQKRLRDEKRKLLEQQKLEKQRLIEQRRKEEQRRRHKLKFLEQQHLLNKQKAMTNRYKKPSRIFAPERFAPMDLDPVQRTPMDLDPTSHPQKLMDIEPRNKA